VKRRKACAGDEPATSGEIRNLSGPACVLATDGDRNSLFLPREICWVAPSEGFGANPKDARTKGHWPNRSQTTAYERKAGESQSQPKGESHLGERRRLRSNECHMQLELTFETAEEGAKAPGDGARAEHRSSARACALPKSKVKPEKAQTTTMEAVVGGLWRAFESVAANKGAPGPDRQSIEHVREHLFDLVPKLSQALLAGDYRPGEIRRVWIPKAGGKGLRGLGIPNVIDRMVQEAVRQVLEPVYEPTFHPSSHGFRPGRSCHTAIAQACEYLQEGQEWVVDLDLENFFNRVNHQRLMARLAMRVGDKRVLRLIGQMLKARVVMPDGVVASNDEGVPQGGPLSPLLSNVVLDELDWELQERGHRFVRYADDANIYVKSERAGQRVMASVSDFIDRRLRLKVNAAKSAVAQPQERHFLGFSLRREPLDGSVEVGLSKRTKERIDSKKLVKDVHRQHQRVRDRMDRLLWHLLGTGRADIAGAGRASSPASTGHGAQAVQTQTHHRSSIDSVRDPSQDRVAQYLLGPQVLVGAEPLVGGGSGTAEFPLGCTRA
jgi:group II intron reverse transcriptase/maturase